MQTWPALRNLLAAIALAATSTSASSKTITGAWPPSSIVTRFMCWPASAASCLPTTVEPVNEILRITGCGIRYARDLGRVAVDQADHARRHAGVDEGADQLGRRRRRLLRRLDDDRAAGGERRRELAHDLVDREVPGRERRDRPDRLLDDELVDALGARRDHAAVGAPRLPRRTSRWCRRRCGSRPSPRPGSCPAPSSSASRRGRSRSRSRLAALRMIFERS